MINKADSAFIFNHASVPEHLVDYTTSISGAEPFLFGTYLCYKRDEILIFIGYPLGVPFDENQMESILGTAATALKPGKIALVAPTIKANRARIIQRGSDSYFRLELDDLVTSPKVQNMLRRASRELSVETGKGWSTEHRALVSAFLASHAVSEETQYIFNRLPDYLATSETALLLSAHNHQGRIAAFDVADFGSKDYAFYMFNFTSREHYVPGASDLLLHQLITIAREQGKRFVNLGLAINKGITFFKQKWGGIPFLNHEFVLYETSRMSIIQSLFEKL